jgi:hypothetical protein
MGKDVDIVKEYFTAHVNSLSYQEHKGKHVYHKKIFNRLTRAIAFNRAMPLANYRQESINSMIERASKHLSKSGFHLDKMRELSNMPAAKDLPTQP